MEQWVSGLENSQYLPWIVIALLSGDLILPIPSSVVTTYIGGQMHWVTGTLVSWVGMSLGAVIGFTLARQYGPQFALRFSSAAQLKNAKNDSPLVNAILGKKKQEIADLNVDMEQDSKDVKTIDRFGPDGLAKLFKYFSILAVRFQNGFIYHYAFIMLIGFSILLTYFILIK